MPVGRADTPGMRVAWRVPICPPGFESGLAHATTWLVRCPRRLHRRGIALRQDALSGRRLSAEAVAYSSVAHGPKGAIVVRFSSLRV